MDNHSSDSQETTEGDHSKIGELPEPMLSNLSAATEVAGVSITMLVSGAVIEGDLMNATAYFEEEREVLNTRGKFENDPGAAEDLIREFIGTTLSMPSSSELPERERHRPRRFVHLKNVSITGAGFTPGYPRRQDRLRVPIEKVSGWCLGRSE